jgi:hypothetical protein
MGWMDKVTKSMGDSMKQMQEGMGDSMKQMQEGMSDSMKQMQEGTGEAKSTKSKSSNSGPAAGVPDMGSNARNIRKYQIVDNPEYIDDQYHYMIGKCAEFFIESTSNDLQRALVAKIRECVTRWKKLDEETYNKYFSQLLPSDYGADINGFRTVNGYRAMVAALDLAELLTSQLVVDDNERIIDVLNDITQQFLTNADLIYFEGTQARVLSLFSKLTTKAKKEGILQEWLHGLPLSTVLPMKTNGSDQDQFFLRLVELMEAPSDSDHRVQYNQKLATYYLSGYGQFNRAIPAFKSVRSYLRAEAKKLPANSSSQEVLNCASCGACVDAAEAQCGFCGTRIVRGADGTKSKIDLAHLLPIKTEGEYIDLLSASDTVDNLKSCRIDGTYEEDLEVFQELIAWYKSKVDVYDSWTEGERVLEEFQGMLSGQFPVLAKKARSDSDRERQVTKLLIRWRKDCLNESCNAGMFANEEKKKAKWQEKARDELGFL